MTPVIKATIITADGKRVDLTSMSSTRAQLEMMIDLTFPDARRVSLIIQRHEVQA